MEEVETNNAQQEETPAEETKQEEAAPQEAPAPQDETPTEEVPRLTLAQLLESDADYQAEYNAAMQAREDSIRVDMALENALNQSGARNHKAVLALIERDKIKVRDGKVTGLQEQMDALRKSDPYLFHDNGGKPYFGSSSSGGNPGSSDDATVRARYKNNPWYHG